MDVLRELPRGFAGTVATDPPYGTQAMGGGYGRAHVTIECDEDLSVVATAMPLLTRALRPDSWFAMCSAVKTRHELETILVTAGLGALGEVVWDKGAPGLGYHIRYAHETVLVRRWGKPSRPSEPLISMYRHTANCETDHPHEKPVGLMQRLVAWTTSPGDIVLDPFGGSGTTAIASLIEGRRCLLIEKDPKYVELINKRIAKFKRDEAETFLPRSAFRAKPKPEYLPGLEDDDLWKCKGDKK